MGGMRETVWMILILVTIMDLSIGIVGKTVMLSFNRERGAITMGEIKISIYLAVIMMIMEPLILGWLSGVICLLNSVGETNIVRN